MATEERNERIALRLSTSERDMAQEIADSIGVSLSDGVRIAIREHFRARFPDRPIKSSRAKGPAKR